MEKERSIILDASGEDSGFKKNDGEPPSRTGIQVINLDTLLRDLK